MRHILQTIQTRKREELARARKDAPPSALEALLDDILSLRPFRQSLEKRQEEGAAIIAEIKKASPSKGVIREDFDPADLAKNLEKGGAACLSVLTDKDFFQGAAEHLRQAKEATALPILRKDFLIDPYQALESRAWGADAVLLIMALLERQQAAEIAAAAKEWEMDILAEAHDEKELEEALRLEPDMIGINNRNLKSFETSLDVSLRLAKEIPRDALAIAESGIESHDDILRLQEAGIHCFLIGETLMRADDPARKIRELLGEEDEEDKPS